LGFVYWSYFINGFVFCVTLFHISISAIFTATSFLLRGRGRWQVCKVIYVSAPEDCTRRIMSYPLLQLRERSFV
jgi:hypothetical protein